MLAFFIGFIIGIIFTIAAGVALTIYLIYSDEDERTLNKGMNTGYDYET